jgi:hypothetical protein
MKITNKFNIPQTFVNVVKRPQYTKGDVNLSVTELLNSPQIVQLRTKHIDELETDVSEMVWSLFGTAVHNILEHGKDDNHIVEERLFTQFEGWKISGAIDLQETHSDGVDIKDYKVTSAWTVQQEKSEWVSQLNCYAWLVEKVKGQRVRSIQIVGIVRDWSRRDAEAKETYPQAPIVTIDIPLWTFEQREDYIRSRLVLHNEALFSRQVNDELPPCTPEEMWEKPTVYAVKKIGGVRAKTLFSEKDRAEEELVTLNAKKKEYEIEVREGERTRCEKFCQVSQFCSQHTQYLKEKL